METTRVEAWESEDGDLVVWGTRNPEEAKTVFDFYAERSWDASEPRPSLDAWQNGHIIWAAPSMIDQEIWEDFNFSIHYQVEPDWVPVLVCTSWGRE